MNIKAGYQLHITSWVNDGDNYNTTIHDGLSAHDVRFLLSVVSPFRSRYHGGEYGNKHVSGQVIDNHVRECFDNHPSKSDSVYLEWLDVDDDMGNDGLSDIVNELIGYDEHCGWRVFDSFKVYYFPEMIGDVSENFK